MHRQAAGGCLGLASSLPGWLVALLALRMHRRVPTSCLGLALLLPGRWVALSELRMHRQAASGCHGVAPVEVLLSCSCLPGVLYQPPHMRKGMQHPGRQEVPC